MNTKFVKKFLLLGMYVLYSSNGFSMEEFKSFSHAQYSNNLRHLAQYSNNLRHLAQYSNNLRHLAQCAVVPIFRGIHFCSDEHRFPSTTSMGSYIGNHIPGKSVLVAENVYRKANLENQNNNYTIFANENFQTLKILREPKELSYSVYLKLHQLFTNTYSANPKNFFCNIKKTNMVI